MIKFKSLSFFTVEQALNKLGRSLYPFSWPPESELIYKKKVKGDLFNTEEEIEIVENVKPEEIEKILEQIKVLKKGVYLEKPGREGDLIDLSNGRVNFSIECSRLTTMPQSEFPFVERISLNVEFETGDHVQMHHLKHMLEVSHIKHLLLKAASDQLVRIYQTDSDTRDSYCFDDESSRLETIDNWNRILLSGRYMSYIDEEGTDGESIISFWDSPVEVHPVDLQTFINSLLTTKSKTWDLSIEEAFSFLSPPKESSSNYDIITPFLQNIEKTPKLERMPLDQALAQLFQHYSDYALELTNTEALYAKVKTEFPPHEISVLTKPALIMKVTKFFEYLGFKIIEQGKVKEALREDSSLDGKILLKNDPEAIATLLFDPRRKLGGARATPTSKGAL